MPIKIKPVRDSFQAKKSNWEIEPKTFSVDDVINAYIEGRKDGMSELEKIQHEKLLSNIEKLKELSLTFLDLLKAKKISCKSIKLKINTITNFEVLYLVSKEDFISSEFLDVYKLSMAKKKEVASDTFQVDFMFMPYIENINEEKILSDGFIISYNE